MQYPVPTPVGSNYDDSGSTLFIYNYRAQLIFNDGSMQTFEFEEKILSREVMSLSQFEQWYASCWRQIDEELGSKRRDILFSKTYPSYSDKFGIVHKLKTLPSLHTSMGVKPLLIGLDKVEMMDTVLRNLAQRISWNNPS